jgi:hypothetical protein
VHDDLKKESQVRDFLERNEKKLLYKHLNFGKKILVDEQLKELGITGQKVVKTDIKDIIQLQKQIRKKGSG